MSASPATLSQQRSSSVPYQKQASGNLQRQGTGALAGTAERDHPVRNQSATQNVLSSEELKSEARRCVPPLQDENRFKGQMGKIAVLGGSFEGTTPAYLCGLAALKVGADFAHVFCTRTAAPIIKAYTPELLVHPCLHEAAEITAMGEELTEERHTALAMQYASEVEAWFSRLDCLIIGPGLGRDPLLLDAARLVLQRAREAQLPLVLDGDGLVLVAREPELVEGYTNCILTPNLSEFRRLASTMGVSVHGPNNDRIKRLGEVVEQLRGPCVVSKGPVDVIADGRSTVLCSVSAGSRRCGGQGDILAGAIATFVSWTVSFVARATQEKESTSVLEINPIILAAFGGCMITRTTAANAFQLHHRSMLASDMLEQLGIAVDLLFNDMQASSMHHGGGGPIAAVVASEHAMRT